MNVRWQCAVCLESRHRIPCHLNGCSGLKHFTCYSCVGDLETNECPMCRARFTRILPVYLGITRRALAVNALENTPAYIDWNDWIEPPPPAWPPPRKPTLVDRFVWPLVAVVAVNTCFSGMLMAVSVVFNGRVEFENLFVLGPLWVLSALWLAIVYVTV